MNDESKLEELAMSVPLEGSESEYLDPDVEKLRRETKRINAQTSRLIFLTRSIYVATGVVFGVASKYTNFDLDTAATIVVGANIVSTVVAFAKNYEEAPNKIKQLKYIIKGTAVDCTCFLASMYGSSCLLK